MVKVNSDANGELVVAFVRVDGLCEGVGVFGMQTSVNVLADGDPIGVGPNNLEQRAARELALDRIEERVFGGRGGLESASGRSVGGGFLCVLV